MVGVANQTAARQVPVWCRYSPSTGGEWEHVGGGGGQNYCTSDNERPKGGPSGAQSKMWHTSSLQSCTSPYSIHSDTIGELLPTCTQHIHHGSLISHNIKIADGSTRESK